MLVNTKSLSTAQQAYKDAEQILFDSLGLIHKDRYVALSYPEISIRTLSIGEGQPVLLVPGGVGTVAPFATLFSHLQDYRIITFDRPGSGLSDGIDHTRFDLRQLAIQTITSVLDAYHLETVPVISNSMGGLWAFWFGLAYPDRLQSHAQMGCPALVLTTSAPFFMRLISVPLIGNMIHNVAKPADVQAARAGLKFMGQPQETIANLNDEVMAVAYEMYKLPDYDLAWKSLMNSAMVNGRQNSRYALTSEMLARIKQPVQFVWGDNDPFGDLEIARQVCELLPDAHLHTMKGGHLPWLDDPDEIAQVFTAFFKDHI